MNWLRGRIILIGLVAVFVAGSSLGVSSSFGHSPVAEEFAEDFVVAPQTYPAIQKSHIPTSEGIEVLPFSGQSLFLLESTFQNSSLFFSGKASTHRSDGALIKIRLARVHLQTDVPLLVYRL